MPGILERLFFWRHRAEEEKCKRELKSALNRYEIGTSVEIERIRAEVAILAEDVHQIVKRKRKAD